MKKAYFTGASLFALASLAMVPAYAQDAPVTVQSDQTDDEEKTLGTVVITGSFIRRQSQADLASPIDTVDSVDISNIGAQNIGDLTQTLTINTGAQNNPDAFTQGGTTGTSNINLRGLGVASTLILLNGKRQTLSAAPTNDGINFVDTSSLVPLIAVQRVEILKDGASSLYGSDAIAGVANFITREDYDGVLFTGDFTSHASVGEYGEYNLQGLVGKTFGDVSILGAISYLDRTALTTAERRLSMPANDTSSLGNPGAFFTVNDDIPGIPAGTPLQDPGCAAAGGFPIALGPPGVGFCGFDFGEFFNLVPDEDRLTAFGSLKWQVNDSTTWKFEVGYADNNAMRGNSPTFPFLQTALVPADNPGNIFGTTVSFFGRASGNGGSVSPATFESETFRISTDITTDFETSFLKNGRFNVNFTFAENSFMAATEDTVTDRFQCALDGFRGTFGQDCTANNPFLTANGATIPDVGSFFNPFSIDGSINSDPALLDYVIEFSQSFRESDLLVFESYVSGEIFELPAGPVSLAIGGQYRDQDISAQFDEITENDGFAFLIGEQPFSGSQEVYALFAEAAVPLTSWADLQLAVRFEDYNEDGGSTVDPKIALLLRPTDQISLRGSFSTSFRAPSSFQLQGQSTTLQQVNDPVTGGTAFVAVRALGNAALQPEDSQAFNVGGTWAPVDGLEFNIDYYNFSFEDAIIQTAPQAVVDADPNGPNVIRSPAGTIIQVNNGFVNAATIDTSGIDFSARYQFDLGPVQVTPSIVGTYVLEYDLADPLAGAVEGAGNRNFTNFGSPTPEWRFNAGLELAKGPHTFNAFGRFIGGYDDDQNGGAEIDSDFRLDLQYNVNINEFFDRDKAARFTIGVRNVTDETAPFVATNGGFDSRVHDPRGRLVQVGLDLEF
ncbi:MAG: TonB-dependent receptor [Pseudomonadota bacterium]